MNRLLVAFLAAVDALIAAAVGVAAALAPLTVFWVLGLGGTADWGALWPASVRLWQFGNLVPLQITLPPEYLTAVGIDADGATFWLSLAPLAFAGFAALFAARSGARAARAGAWAIGVLAGSVVTAVIAWLLWRTSANPVAAVFGWQALVLPTAVFAVPALLGALVGAWRHGDDGVIDALRIRAARDLRWAAVPEAAARGIGVAVAGFVGVGALFVAVATVLRGGEVVALYEAAHVDALGATMLTLGQLAYLPTLVVWGGAFAAGPGFALGTGTAVSPVGTNLGVLPGVPVLGIIPESGSQWMLLSILLIIGVGFAAGAAARGRLFAAARTGRSGGAGAGGWPGGSGGAAVGGGSAHEASMPRLVVLAAIVILGAAAVALLVAVASGSVGPGRLADVGPAAGPVAFAVGVELLVGAAIALFAPVRASGGRGAPDAVDAPVDSAVAHDPAPQSRAIAVEPVADAPGVAATEPVTDAPRPVAPVAVAADDATTEPFAAGELDPIETLPDSPDAPAQ